MNLVNAHNEFRFEYNIYLGLYIPWTCTDVPSIYRGFATRIEDDVLITDQGCEVLSTMCPKEIEDLYRILDERDQVDKTIFNHTHTHIK